MVDSNYTQSRVIAQIGPDNQTTWYTYGKGLIGQENETGYLTYHFDKRGSTTALTDETGKVTDRISYTAYGELVEHTGNTDIIFKYNGRMGVVTDANGLYYMRARYYNPDIKRFVNADILAGSITDGRTLNRYAYVNGNPISFVDPFGLSAEETEENNDWLHGALDLVGFIPVIGEVFDVINAALYLAEGNFVMAGVSIACSAGADTLFKSAKYAIKAAGEVTQIGIAAVKQITKAGVKSATDIVGSTVGKRFGKGIVNDVVGEGAERVSKKVAEGVTQAKWN